MPPKYQKMTIQSLETIESQRLLSCLPMVHKQILPVIKNVSQNQSSALCQLESNILSDNDRQLFDNDAQLSLIESYKKKLEIQFNTRLAEKERKYQEEREKTQKYHQNQIQRQRQQSEESKKQLNKIRLEQRKDIRQFSLENRQRKTETEINQLKQNMDKQILDMNKKLQEKDQEIHILKQSHQKQKSKLLEGFQIQRDALKREIQNAKKSTSEQLSDSEEKDKEISALKTQLRASQKKIQERDFISRRLAQPQFFLGQRNRMFREFLKELSNYKFQDLNGLSNNQCLSFAVIGKKSAGKTSLINRCLELDLELQIEESNSFIREVNENQSSNGKIKVYDTMGFTNQLTYLSFDVVKQILMMDKIFICFESSIREIQELISVLLAIKPVGRLVFIRTKYDIASNFNHQTNQDELDVLFKGTFQGINNQPQLSKCKDQDKDVQLKIFKYSSMKNFKWQNNSDVRKKLNGE